MGDELADLPRIGACGDNCLLRAPEPGGSDHFHGLRDLLDTLDAGDASSYFSERCHSLLGRSVKLLGKLLRYGMQRFRRLFG